MRALVTGGAGFVGSHLVDELVRRGDDVTILDDFSTGSHENLVSVRDRVRIIPYDLTSNGRDMAFPGFAYDAVFHLAAYADIASNWEPARGPAHRRRIHEVNVTGTIRLLEALEGKPVFVLASTAAVYGSDLCERDDVPDQESLATPNTIESPYAASKLAAEAYVSAYALARGWRWYAARLVSCVGARYAHGHIADFVTMAKRGQIATRDNGNQRKSFVHVRDAAEAMIALVHRRAASGIYNVASEGTWSIRDTLRAMKIEDAEFAERPAGWIGDPVNLQLDTRKLRYFHRCTRSIGDGVFEALAYMGWT